MLHGVDPVLPSMLIYVCTRCLSSTLVGSVDSCCLDTGGKKYNCLAVCTANTCRRHYLSVLDLGGSVQTSVALTTTAISYGVAISCAHVINKYTRAAADGKQNKPAARSPADVNKYRINHKQTNSLS